MSDELHPMLYVDDNPSLRARAEKAEANERDLILALFNEAEERTRLQTERDAALAQVAVAVAALVGIRDDHHQQPRRGRSISHNQAAEEALSTIGPRAEAMVRVVEAATFLSNELIGGLPLFEPIARRELGNSNYTILMQRAVEVRQALALLTKETKSPTMG